MTVNTNITPGPFLPLDYYLRSSFEESRELIATRERLTATLMNIKENGVYERYEVLNGQGWFGFNAAGLPYQPKSAYRTTFDLVALNGGAPIPVGATIFVLSATTSPPLISFANALIPLPSTGAATTAANFFFINDPLVFVRTNNMTTAVQNIIITNNTGAPLTQAYWEFNYLKT